MIERYPIELLQKQPLDRLVSIRDAEMMIQAWCQEWNLPYEDTLPRIRRILDKRVLEHHKIHNPRLYKKIMEIKCRTI